MANLRSVIEENITKAQAEVDKYKADLAALEALGGNWLERDLKEFRDWVQSIATHLFSPAANAAVTATPGAPVLTIVPAGDTAVELPDTISTATATADNAEKTATNDATPPAA